MSSVTFILHKPQLSENIGACARAIKNFNFNKLAVINPKPLFPNDKIVATSVGAKEIIKSCKVFNNLETSIKNIDFLKEIFKGPKKKTNRDLSCEERVDEYLADRLQDIKEFAQEASGGFLLICKDLIRESIKMLRLSS